MTTAGKTIGILTSGGDCPGLNAAIRGVGKTAILEYGMKVKGFVNGFQGLIEGEVVELEAKSLSGLLTLGGTVLGTSREKPFKKDASSSLDKPNRILKTVEDLKLDCIVCIGGNGTQKTAEKLSRQGLPVIGIPKTIDNDVWGTDQSFGFDSAVAIATEAIDRLHSTANSHRRIMVVEVMGHHTGWLALHSGIAGGGDVILIPEIPHDPDTVAQYIKKRIREGKAYSIVVVAEGARPPSAEGPGSVAEAVSREIETRTGIETRNTILGYIQRGGSPSAVDRLLATRFGAAAAQLIAEERYGRMVCLQGTEIGSLPLAETAGRIKTVDPANSLIAMARKLNTCFGD